MSNVLEFPLSNPLVFFEQDRVLPSDVSGLTYASFHPAYNQKGFDNGFFAENNLPHEEKLRYAQPYQTSEYIIFQFNSSITGTGNFTVALLDTNGNAVTIPSGNLTLTQVGTYNSMYNYCAKILLYNMPEGYYFVRVNTTSGTYKYAGISELVNVRISHPNTVVCLYNNSYSDNNMIWDGTYNINYMVRFHGKRTDVKPESVFHVYDSQPMDTVLVSGKSKRLYEISLGYGTKGVPTYVVDKLERIMMCNSTVFDGVALTRSEGSKFEENKIEGLPLSHYKIIMAERYNKQLVEVVSDRVEFGNMPQTNYFWIERMKLNNVFVNIRKMFAGKIEFLGYLNQVISPQYGGVVFTESPNNKIIMTAPSTITSPYYVDDADILKYCVKFTLKGSGTFQLDLFSTATKTYAVVYNDGYANVNKTNYTTSVTISKSYAATGSNKRDMYVFFSDADGLFTYTSGTNKVISIGGDLGPSTTDLALATSQVEYIENDMWKYCAHIVGVGLDGQKLPTSEINKVIKWMFTYINTGSVYASTDISLNGQTPSAPPTKTDAGISYMMAKLNEVVSSLQTD